MIKPQMYLKSLGKFRAQREHFTKHQLPIGVRNLRIKGKKQNDVKINTGNYGCGETHTSSILNR